MKKVIKIVEVAVIVILGWFLLSPLLISPKKEQNNYTTISSTPKSYATKSPEATGLEQITNKNLHISKNKYDFYYESYLKLSKLQDKYESTYAKFGEVGFDEAKEIPTDAEFPNYGSIEREIIAINNNIPTYNSNMLPEELDLVIRLKEYSTALIFLTPKENEIDGIVFASGKRKIIKDLLDKTKTVNGF